MYKLKISKEDTSKYDYGTAKISGFKTLKELNLPDDYFGGRAKRIVSLKDDNNLLVVDNLNKVIGVMELEEEVTNDDSASTIFSCGDCGKEFNTALKLSSHRRFCKAGGV